jgi:acetolactate synthase I/II/III large subunit
MARGQSDSRFPLAPQRVVADTRAALRRGDVVVVDTGAAKIWMARLYLSTMAFALPGARGVKLVEPDPKVRAARGTAPSW